MLTDIDPWIILKEQMLACALFRQTNKYVHDEYNSKQVHVNI